jgi:hypothetical protein
VHQRRELGEGVLFGGNGQVQFAISAQPGTEADDLAAGVGIMTAHQAFVHVGVNAGDPLGFLMQGLDDRLPRLVVGVAQNQVVLAGCLGMAQACGQVGVAGLDQQAAMTEQALAAQGIALLNRARVFANRERADVVGVEVEGRRGFQFAMEGGPVLGGALQVVAQEAIYTR